jgi:lysophospholipase L1-like esterase
MTQDIRICFVGDSFVNGTGDETSLGWAGRLCGEANRICQVTYYNLGVRRDTSKDLMLRWHQECNIRLPDFVDGRIVISCGVNDTVIEGGKQRVNTDESAANIREILHEAQKRYKVIMVGPPPVGEHEQDKRIQGVSTAFARECGALGIPYIDLFSVLSLDDTYKSEVSSNDGAHPKSTGYLKMAKIISYSPSWWFHSP